MQPALCQKAVMAQLLKPGIHLQTTLPALAVVSSWMQQQASAWFPSLSLIPQAQYSSGSAAQMQLSSSSNLLDSTTVAASGFTVRTHSATRSGYTESLLSNLEANAQKQQQQADKSGQIQGTLQILKIPLANDESPKDTSDMSMPASQQQQPQQEDATPPDDVARHKHVQEVQAVLSKLVGSLTKEGKKHVAQAIVRDTLRIMQERLAAGEGNKATATS